MNLEPLSPHARELLDAEVRAPSGAPPDPQALERVLARLGLPAVPAAPSPATPAAPVAAGVGTSLLGGKALLAAAMLATGALIGSGATYVVMRPEPEPGPEPAPAREEPRPLPPPSLAERLATPAPPPASPEAEGPREPRPKSAASEGAGVAAIDEGRLRAEQVLLDTARSALLKGSPDGALAALARHEREHPRGALLEEREALTVQALAQRGDRAQAEAGARRFRQRFPSSIFLPVVDQAIRP